MPTCTLCDSDDEVQGGGPFVRNSRADIMEYNCPRCGRYFYDRIKMHHVLTKPLRDERYVIAGVLRSRAERGDNTFGELTAESVTEMLETAPIPRTTLEYVDSLLLHLARQQDRPWVEIRPNKDRDYPLMFMRNADDMVGFMVFAAKLGYLKAEPDSKWSFTIKGWERVEQLRVALPDSHQAFVAMWFDESLNEVYEKGFKQGIEGSNYFAAIRSDEAHHLGKVDDWIIAQIRRSGLVVADFTGNRGGVYFEAGFALALGIPVVFTCRRDHMKDVHVDTNHFSHVTWETPEDLKRQLHDRIMAAVLPQVARR